MRVSAENACLFEHSQWLLKQKRYSKPESFESGENRSFENYRRNARVPCDCGSFDSVWVNGDIGNSVLWLFDFSDYADRFKAYD